MGIVSIIVIGVGLYFLSRWTLKNFNGGETSHGGNPMVRVSARAEARARANKEASLRKYGRRHGSPRFHREALRPFAPYGLLILAPIALTAFFARDAVALILAGVGCGLLASGVLYYFNREARGVHNEDRDADAYMATATVGLDDFTVPEEWSKYL